MKDENMRQAGVPYLPIASLRLKEVADYFGYRYKHADMNSLDAAPDVFLVVRLQSAALDVVIYRFFGSEHRRKPFTAMF